MERMADGRLKEESINREARRWLEWAFPTAQGKSTNNRGFMSVHHVTGHANH